MSDALDPELIRHYHVLAKRSAPDAGLRAVRRPGRVDLVRVVAGRQVETVLRNVGSMPRAEMLAFDAVDLDELLVSHEHFRDESETRWREIEQLRDRVEELEAAPARRVAPPPPQR